MPNFYRLMMLTGMVLLLGCHMINPPETKGRAALDNFVYALRWQQWDAAAAFMLPEFGEDFRDRFQGMKDLTILDVRRVNTQLSAEGRRAEATIEMDYYLLPSVTVKTLRIDQTWVYFEPEGNSTVGYLITTPFPPLP